tara:strand:- start:162 stop:914 length:753 start_codon:yes stop_codon:yes gene_type:complete
MNQKKVDISMNCNCGEKAFTFTRISSQNGKKYTSLVGRCNKSLEDTKKKKKCSFREEKVLEVIDLPPLKIKELPPQPTPRKIKTREDNIYTLNQAIDTIKMCQTIGYPFLSYTNRILYLSKQLNIPPYIQEKVTIDEYAKIADYYLKNPIPRPKHKPHVNYSLLDEILPVLDADDYDYFKKLLSINRQSHKISQPKKKAKTTLCYSSNIEFRTGGLDEEEEPNEDELDVEQFDSEEEQDDYDDDTGNYSD